MCKKCCIWWLSELQISLADASHAARLALTLLLAAAVGHCVHPCLRFVGRAQSIALFSCETVQTMQVAIDPLIALRFVPIVVPLKRLLHGQSGCCRLPAQHLGHEVRGLWVQRQWLARVRWCQASVFICHDGVATLSHVAQTKEMSFEKLVALLTQ